MSFDIKQLVVFTTVADCQSFSGAAKQLGMAQASVSERIANLERALGARLFDRLGRRTELTAAGEVFIERARELIALRDAAEKELQAFLGVTGGKVTIGGSTAPGEYRVPQLLGTFAKQHPDVEVRLIIGGSEQIIEGVESGAFDLGVIGRRIKGETIVSRKTWSDELVLTVPASHPWARRRKPVGAAELAAEPWIFREAGSATRLLAERFLKRSIEGGTRALRVAAELGSTSAIKEGLKAGLGIALMSEATVATEVAAGSLAKVPVAGLSASRSFYLIRDKRRTLSPVADTLWQYILESI